MTLKTKLALIHVRGTQVQHFSCVQQAPPMQLSHEQKLLLENFRGAFLTIVVEPRHCSTPESIERLVWMLLTFYSYLDLQVKSFKVCSS